MLKQSYPVAVISIFDKLHSDDIIKAEKIQDSKNNVLKVMNQMNRLSETIIIDDG